MRSAIFLLPVVGVGAVILLWSTPTPATTPTCPKVPDACEQVRNVRYLASKDRLDESSFDTLEKKFCKEGLSVPMVAPSKTPVVTSGNSGTSTNPATTGSSGTVVVGKSTSITYAQDCNDLTILVRLTAISPNKNDYEELKARRNTACSMPMTSESTEVANWKSGVVSRYKNGSWNYPTGVTAKASDGAWYYSQGPTAKDTTGIWYYPNGVAALSAKGIWTAPDGLSTDLNGLVSRACEKSTADCNAVRQSLPSMSGDDLASRVIEFVWVSWQKK